MKKFILAVLVFIPTISWGASGSEGFNVGISGLIYNIEFSGDDYAVASEDKNTYGNLKLGYLMSNNIYLGAIYATLSRNNGTTTASRTATGAQLGYHSDGYFLDFTYYFSGQYKLSDALIYKEASGIGLEVGYNTMVSSNFYIGAELNYMSLNYKKRDILGIVADRRNTVTEMYPMLNAGFMF